MTEHQKIKQMLETNPTCEKVLDEINSRIWCLHKGYEYLNPCPRGQHSFWFKINNGEPYIRSLSNIEDYVRSLDVLHDAQLEGWDLSSLCWDGEGYECRLYNCLAPCAIGLGQTEALARCHAFVQTLEWEAENE